MPDSSHAQDHPRANDASCEYHLFGYITGSFGLGESARHTLRRLRRLQIGLRVFEISTGDHRMGQIPEFAHLVETPGHDWPGSINLFHLNPPEAEHYILSNYSKLPLRNCLNVAVPFWEVPALPPSWLPSLRAMDCILAPTLFIRDVIARELPEKPVIHYPQNIPVPQAVEADRSAFGLPQDAFVLLCGFDALSDSDRKNPWASIKTFQQAFPDNDKARLVIKVSNASYEGVGEKLKALAAGDPRILIIEEILPREQLQRLYASCDALVSLHRSEGLGLFIMEMMAQAKPVIVTAWSGNMDFTNSENSCLVDYRMVPVQSKHPSYASVANRKEACWAEADHDEAVKWMRDLAADPDLRMRIGNAARQSMIERASDDCPEVFEQLRQLQKHGINRRRPAVVHYRRLRRRLRLRRLERKVKTIIRGKASKG